MRGQMAIHLNNLGFRVEKWIVKKISLLHLPHAAVHLAVLNQVLWCLLQPAAMIQDQGSITTARCYIQSRLN